MNKPAAQARPTGGFNQGIGFFNEHLDENALQAAAKQKALSQQASATTTAPAQSATGSPANAQPAQPPREIGTVTEELITRPAQAIKTELASFFDINALLGIKGEDDPQVQAKKRQLHTHYQNLDAKQKEVAQQRFQEEMKKKKQAEEQQAAREQQRRQAEAQTFKVPSSPKKGPVGPGMSKKASATAQLEHDRKTLSGPKSVN